MTSPTTTSDRPLRCLHYVDAVVEEAGGVVRAVLDLTAALAQQGIGGRGIEVTLLTGDAQDVPKSWLADESGTPRVEVISRSLTPWLSLGTADREAVSAAVAAADVVHLHTPWDPCNVAIAAEARRTGTPYMVSVHGMLDDWSMTQRGLKKRVYLSVAGRRMLEGAARIHFTAEGERQQAMKLAPRGSAVVLPLVMDLSPYRTLPGPQIARDTFADLQRDGAKLLFLSRVHPKKGVELLIEAVAAMRKRGDAVTALIAGPGDAAYVESLKQLATKLGVTDDVCFLGMVRGEAKLSLYQACDLFVLPTSQENFGIVLTEAMACATPIVTTRGVDIWQELQDRDAVIVDATPPALVEAIDQLLAEGDKLKTRGERSRTAVLDWLDPQTVVSQYVDLYRQCCRA
ncbi:MAG: glycosyltransferase [Planctomycetota bacterium]